MQKSLYNRVHKSHYHNDDYGRGKSKTAKARHRRHLKRRAKNIMRGIFEQRNAA